MHQPTITVLYFAALRDLAGTQEETVVLPAGLRSIGELKAHLESLHPSLRGHLLRVRFARNEAFAGEDVAIEQGDTIALIPPVAGG